MPRPEPTGPGRHPPPPEDLASRALPIRITAPGEAWLRIHRLAHDPLYFGRSGLGRFDAPAGEYGVLYAASDLCGAFLETLGRQPQQHVVAAVDIRSRAASSIQTAQALRLVDLTATGLRRIGADARLCATEDYRLAQQWALALWQHPERPAGLYDAYGLSASGIVRRLGLTLKSEVTSLV